MAPQASKKRGPHLPITIVSLPARTTASIRNRVLPLFPYSQSHHSLPRHQRKARKGFLVPFSEHREILRARRESVGSSRQTRRSEMRMVDARVGMFTVLFGGFLLFGCSTSTFTLSAIPNDGYPHYAKNGVCVDHVGNPERLGTATPKRFTMCQANSGATSWFAAVKQGTTTVCPFGSLSQPYIASSPQSFNCTLANGTYKAFIYYWVGSSQMMTHLDQYFTVP